MTEKELLYIISIADEASISRAAKKLFIAQPSLSQALKRIEDSLHTSLFIRSSSGLRLSPSGECYYKYAKQILRLYDNMKSEIQDIDNLIIGKINLGCTNYLSLVMLPEIIAEFSKIYPNVDINVLEDTSKKLYDALINSDIEFAIMHLIEGEFTHNLKTESLYTEEFLILASKDNPVCDRAYIDKKSSKLMLDINELKQEKFIMLSDRQRIRQIVDRALSISNINPHIYISLQNFVAATEMVRQNLGISILPKSYLNSGSKEGLVYMHIPQKYKAYWSLSLAYNPKNFLSNADKAFLELVHKRFNPDKASISDI